MLGGLEDSSSVCHSCAALSLCILVLNSLFVLFICLRHICESASFVSLSLLTAGWYVYRLLFLLLAGKFRGPVNSCSSRIAHDCFGMSRGLRRLAICGGCEGGARV